MGTEAPKPEPETSEEKVRIEGAQRMTIAEGLLHLSNFQRTQMMGSMAAIVLPDHVDLSKRVWESILITYTRTGLVFKGNFTRPLTVNEALPWITVRSQDNPPMSVIPEERPPKLAAKLPPKSAPN